MAWKKNNPGCPCCNCTHIGPCAATIPEVLALTDPFYSVTVPFIWTPNSPASPCVGFWLGFATVNYPGVGGAFPCAAASGVVIRYAMAFAGTPSAPILNLAYTTVNPTGGCPAAGSMSGPFGGQIPGQVFPGFVRQSWNCPPGFAASFKCSAIAIYSNTAVTVTVSTPP